METIIWALGTFITIQLGVSGFLCVTQIRQSVQIATLTAKVDVLMGERENSNASRKIKWWAHD